MSQKHNKLSAVHKFQGRLTDFFAHNESNIKQQNSICIDIHLNAIDVKWEFIYRYAINTIYSL